MAPHNLRTKVPMPSIKRCYFLALTKTRWYLQARALPARGLPHDTAQDPFSHQNLPSKHRQTGEDLSGCIEEYAITVTESQHSLIWNRQLVPSITNQNDIALNTGPPWCSEPRRPTSQRCCSTMERGPGSRNSDSTGVDQDTRHDLSWTGYGPKCYS
jgi:hypothetical protein